VNVPLVAVAHGSRDPRSAAAVRALVARVTAEAPELDVRASFLDLSEPRVTSVLRDLHAEGHGEAVVVPLLLGSAYHARVDLPALVDGVTAECPGLSVSIADVLGIDPALEQVALDRLAESGADLSDPGFGLVLAAVGSSNTSANAAVSALASRWQNRLGIPVAPAFASAAKPDIPGAVAKLRARGAERVAVASWFLAPGLLPDRITSLTREAAPDALIAEPLAAAPGVADVILHRYAEALTSRNRRAS
jgi:sirohydrochlorin ferrochelatase